MGHIQLLETKIKGNRIDYNFDVSDDLKKFFKLPLTFWVEYDFDLTSVPQSIACIPFVANMLPLVWVTDSKLIVNELDEDYFNSMSETKKAFCNIYPHVQLKGEFVCESIVKNVSLNTPEGEKERATSFFSGGVDSCATLAAHAENDEVDLVTIWGADIKTCEEDSWERVKASVSLVGEKFALKNVLIKSYFRDGFDYYQLGLLIEKDFPAPNWWLYYQHGIGLLAHVAPYAYVKGVTVHYIPATNTKGMNLDPIGSCVEIDETVKFCGCRVVHDQFELTRMQRLKLALDWSKKRGADIPIRVCFLSEGNGGNCCMCPKCFGTIAGILACNSYPKNHGFDFDIENMSPIQIYVYDNLQKTDLSVYADRFYREHYSEISEIVNANKDELIKSGIYKYIGWISNLDDIEQLPAIKKYKRKKNVYNIGRKIYFGLQSISFVKNIDITKWWNKARKWLKNGD